MNPSHESSAKTNSSSTDEAATALKSSITADAHDLKDKATDLGGGMVDQAKKSAESQIAGGKERVAQGLGSVAEAMRHTGEHLRAQDKLGLTQYVARAADQVEAASGYLEQRDLREVLGDLSSFARREPAIFLGGAFALGLLGGRFLKSSHVQPSRQSSTPPRSTDGMASPRYDSQAGQSNHSGNSGRRQGNHGSDTGPTMPGGYVGSSVKSNSSSYETALRGSAPKQPGNA